MFSLFEEETGNYSMALHSRHTSQHLWKCRQNRSA